MRMRVVTAVLWTGFLLLVACGGGSGDIFLPQEAGAQTGQSNASLNGAYGFSFSGFENNGRYIVAVGRIVFDGSGTITGGVERRTETGGFETEFALSGTYAVNSDGTGTVTMVFFGGSVDTWKIVLTAGGQRVKMVSIEPNNFLFGAMVGEMEKQ